MAQIASTKMRSYKSKNEGSKINTDNWQISNAETQFKTKSWEIQHNKWINSIEVLQNHWQNNKENSLLAVHEAHT